MCAFHLGQIGLATSELLILNDIAMSGFGLNLQYSTIFVISLALIAYIYCLVGGYLAVFRTDIVQFIFIIIMGATISIIVLFSNNYKVRAVELFGLMPNLWIDPFGGPAFVSIPINLIISFLMGYGFIVASPDSWKRVFVITKYGRRKSLLPLFVAGMLPFALILPIAFLIIPSQADRVHPLKVLIETSTNMHPIIMLIVTIGIVSCFLSSFDSALITAVHARSIYATDQQNNVDTLSGYYLTTGIIFLIINIMFISFKNISATNPYFVAVMLMAIYAVVSGCHYGNIWLQTQNI